MPTDNQEISEVCPFQNEIQDESIKSLILRLEKENQQIVDITAREEEMKRIRAIAEKYDGDDKVTSFEEIAEEIKKTPPAPKMASKVTKLDEMLHGGFMTQTVTVVSASPKAGKTSFCMFLTYMLQDQNPMWLALEESPQSLIRKMINKGIKEPHGYTPKKKSAKIDMKWVELKIVESIAKFDTKVVFIDQLDFIVPQNSDGDRHDLKVAQTMRDLHDIAVKWDIAIFLICHISMLEPEIKPTTRNFRGSSAIHGECDNAILLWKECKKEKGELIYTNNVLVMLQANREDGDTGSVKMKYENGMFMEHEWNEDNDESTWRGFAKF